MSNNKTHAVAIAISAALFNLAVAPTASAQPKPALTRDVDRASAQPVSNYCRTQTNIKCNLFTVPAGKRLIVETITYQVTSFAPGTLRQIVFGLDDPRFFLSPGIGPNVYSVAAVLGYTSSFGGVESREYTATQPLRAYFDEHQVFAAVVYVTAGASSEQIFNFSGYLVDK